MTIKTKRALKIIGIIVGGIVAFCALAMGLFWILFFGAKYCDSPASFKNYVIPEEIRDDGVATGNFDFVPYNVRCTRPDVFKVGDIVAYKISPTENILIGRILEVLDPPLYRVKTVEGDQTIQHEWIVGRD